MTENSKICQFMEEHGKDWETFFKSSYPDITIKRANEDYPYVLFIYGIGADFADPVVQEARGIIINEDTHEVVCWPFRKFGKYYESYADEIDWKTARVQEKIDGSIIKLWFDKIDGVWQFSTNSEIFAKNAKLELPNGDIINFLELIKKSTNFSTIVNKLEHNELDKDKTYIFELTSIENQVVVLYNVSLLYHIGTRSNITGEEFDDDIGVEKPFLYSLKSLDKCISFLDATGDSGQIDSCALEGFVVVDAQYNRVKIKSPIYVILHNIINNGETSVRLLVDYLVKDKINIESLSLEFPNRAHFLKYYDFKVTEFLHRADALLNISRKLYKLAQGDRKVVANIIKSHPYSSIAFSGLDNNKTLMEILEESRGGITKTICKHIPKYEPENLSNYFAEFYKVNETEKVDK